MALAIPDICKPGRLRLGNLAASAFQVLGLQA